MKSATRATPGLKPPDFEITFWPEDAIMPGADSSTRTFEEEKYMSARIKCTRCDHMILEVTARLNNGLCGHCKDDQDKVDFDAIIKGWIDSPSTLPGAHGNPEPEDFAWKLAASQIRRRLYPTEENKIENFCQDFCDAAETKYEKSGTSCLSAREKHSLAVETFYAEVLNGGLAQYIVNDSGSFAQWADEAFDSIGIPAYAAVIRKLKELFPNGAIPEDSNDRWKIAESIDDDRLEAIEKPFWERYQNHKTEIRDAMYAYLKDQILEQE